VIVYVLPHAGRCGGVRVVGEHVSRLCARGHVAQVWGLSGSFSDWFPRPVPHRLFSHTDQLGVALREFRGVKVATFWVTASWVVSNLLPGEKGFYLVQDEDELTYSGSTAGTSYRLGLTHITEGVFVTEEIQRKYGVSCHNVGIGYDERVFYPLPMIRDRLRILTPYRLNAGPNDLKGRRVSLSVWEKVRTTIPGSSIVTFGSDGVPRGVAGPHVHVSPTDGQLRELYNQSGVFLHTARHEGFGLPMLEAMACGLPVVCTDSHGNREFCLDGRTALVRSDVDSLAAACVEVMTQAATFEKLSAAGLEMSKKYRWGPVVERLEDVYGLRSGG
jgi:hypothetical protein